MVLEIKRKEWAVPDLPRELFANVPSHVADIKEIIIKEIIRRLS